MVPEVSAEKKHRRVIDPSAKRMVYLEDMICDLPLDTSAQADLEAPREALKGHHLLGGYLRGHFGHFLVECISALWPLDKLEGKVDGIVYFLFHEHSEESPAVMGLKRSIRQRLDAMNIDVLFQIIVRPTQVEKLTVAEPGFGFEQKVSGYSTFRNYFRRKNVLAPKALAKVKREKIYITRSQLPYRKGNVVGEEALEKTFAAAGYRIFAPEKHELNDQADTYRAAEKIVAVEGSALHLPPFMCPKKTPFAVISRRSTRAQIENNFGTQIKAFTEKRPLISHNITCCWGMPGAERPRMDSISVIDFDRTYTDLIVAGFLPEDARLFYPSPQDLAHHIQQASLARKAHMRILGLEEAIEQNNPPQLPHETLPLKRQMEL